MMVGNTSYIAVDSDTNIMIITKKMKAVSVMLYDFNVHFKSQLSSISRRNSTILWAKSKSELSTRQYSAR
jgi:hypothetical protein